MKKKTKDILLKAVGIYCFIAVIGVILFNYTYVLDHGMSQWIPQGLIISTLQGVYKPALIPYYIVEEFIDDYKFKKHIETDPHYQSILRSTDALNIVGNRSFEELDLDKRHKVMMKCAEAYALATLPSAEQFDDEPYFYKYLYGLKIIANTHYLSNNVEQVDQALEMIRDYLYIPYYE